MAVPHLTEEDARKLVGPETEIVTSLTAKVSCNGDGGALGHPKTYYTISDKGFVQCTYCDRVFILAPKP